jgi:ornithine cyclodeaminase/alanine dehydrogenase-like protein (mu-crystallin family)
MAIEAVEEVSRKQASGEVVVHPRRRFEFPGGRFFHHMAAADYAASLVATKQYTYVNGRLIFVVSLYSMETGALLALIEGDYLGQLRTGAASGVATKYLARARKGCRNYRNRRTGAHAARGDCGRSKAGVRCGVWT